MGVLMSANNYIPSLRVKDLLEELNIPVYYARRHVPELQAQMRTTELVIEIEIDRTAGGRVGVDIIPEPRGGLQIVRIEPDALVGQWNARCPADRKVEPGDRIKKVNGEGGDHQFLTTACRRKEKLKMTIVRDIVDVDPYVEAKRRDMQSALRKFYGSAPGGARRNVISVGDSYHEQQAIKALLKSETEVLPDAATRREQPPLCKTVHLLERPTLQQLGNQLRMLALWMDKMVKDDRDFDMDYKDLDGWDQAMISAPPKRTSSLPRGT